MCVATLCCLGSGPVPLPDAGYLTLINVLKTDQETFYVVLTHAFKLCRGMRF